jgi:hypothetical protein
VSNAIVDGLRAAGLSVTPLQQEGRPVRLTWDPATEILGTRAMIVIPDIHFATGLTGDVFANDGTSALATLSRLVDATIAVKGSWEASGKRLSVVQLGDLYDVWRAYPTYVDHPTSDYRIIEDAYGAVLGKLMGPADARVCVGNHDATLALYPPSWGRDANGPNGRLAYAQSFVNGRVLAFHGHQVDQLVEAMGGQEGDSAAKLATIVAKLSNPLSMLLQRGVDFAIDFFSDPSVEQFEDVAARQWPEWTAVGATGPFSAPRWSDRDGREHLRAVLEGITGSSTVRVALVGHSHRPGVTAVTVGDRFVPVVDVGSWVWGAAQIAIGVEGELALYEVS